MSTSTYCFAPQSSHFVTSEGRRHPGDILRPNRRGGGCQSNVSIVAGKKRIIFTKLGKGMRSPRVLRQAGRTRRHKTFWSSAAAVASTSVDFPRDYDELLDQVRTAASAALKDSKKLMEIEFPTAGLDTVPGDAEGGIEMNTSMLLVREFCRVFSAETASRTRIVLIAYRIIAVKANCPVNIGGLVGVHLALSEFFPDISEVESARKNVFEGTPYKLDYLSKPSGLEDFGFGKKEKIADHVQAADAVFVAAYPYFNVNEMIAVEELYQDSAEASGRPIIVFNGELDRIRSGYYPSFFYPKLGALAKNFLPKFETVYYIHNFKGRSGGTLFRAYPGPWQVLRRVDYQFVCIHELETMPTLKEVALNILTS